MQLNHERFRTVARQDPEFNSLLDGTFSKSHRALPMRSMNVGTAREEVTFEMVPVSEIQFPSQARLAWTLIRPPSLGFSLVPMLVAWLFGWSRGHDFKVNLVISALVAVLLFHAGVNILDDYFDHRRGRDRLNPRGGSRVIQNGWMRARTLFVAGFGLVGLAILVGLPVVLSSPLLVFVTAVFALLGGLAFVSESLRLKFSGLGESTTFLLTGPLLTCGFAWATSEVLRWEYLILGCAFGFTAVTYYHLKNIENIMIDSQAGARTWAARLGFDGAKRAVWVLNGLAGASVIAFGWTVGSSFVFLIALLIHGFVSFPIARGLSATPSPLSSELKEWRRRGLLVHWTTGLALAACILATRALASAGLGY